MPKICYTPHRFTPDARALIDTCDDIIKDYQAQGFTLTLRQLYYRLVSTSLIPNTEKSYKRIGSIVNDGRLAGLIDWAAIEDRTRFVRQNPHWDSARQMIRGCAEQFLTDIWANQPKRVECFTPNTPVFVGGFLPTSIAAVSVGDLVLTHTGRPRVVSKTIRNLYAGKMLRVKAAGLLPIEVTPEHPFWVSSHNAACPGYKGQRRRFLDAGWSKAESLHKFDLLHVPLIPSAERCSIYGSAVEVAGGPKSVTHKFVVDHSTLMVCGLYLAEGSIRGDGRTVQFTFGDTEKTYADIVVGWAAAMGVGFSTARGRGTRVVYLYSKALADWFHKQFGNGAYSKRLPEWLMFAFPSEQSIVVEYYFRGDGSWKDRSRSALDATTRSVVLAQQLQMILLWSRHCCSLDSTMDHGTPRWRISVGGKSAAVLADEWHIHIPPKGKGRSARYNHIQFSESYALFPIRKVEEFDYEGEVWNLEVKDDHSYCVPAAAHNCWVEKDALVGVFEPVCQKFDVPLLSCRGYTSQSEMWTAGQRLNRYREAGQEVTILHFGDHDPSGLDMTRDIATRLAMFAPAGRDEEPLLPNEDADFYDDGTVQRIALTLAQIKKFQPPPNPAKMDDSRYKAYVKQYGEHSWELDALPPATLATLAEDEIAARLDPAKWKEAWTEVGKARRRIKEVATCV